MKESKFIEIEAIDKTSKLIVYIVFKYIFTFDNKKYYFWNKIECNPFAVKGSIWYFSEKLIFIEQLKNQEGFIKVGWYRFIVLSWIKQTVLQWTVFYRVPSKRWSD